MLEPLGRSLYRHRWAVLAGALALIAFSALCATRVFADLVSGGFGDPGSESARSAQIGAERVGRPPTDVLALYRHDRLEVDDPAMRRAVTGVVRALPPEDVQRVVSYYGTGAGDLVSRDRRATYLRLALHGRDDAERRANLAEIEPILRAPGHGVRVTIGGGTALDRQFNEQAAADLRRAEMLSAPLVLALLVVIFGGPVAACLPLAIGAATVAGALAVLRALGLFTDVSIYAVNVASLLGLGLAIDYGLFMVVRFRQELGRRGSAEHAVRDAVAATVATAGRTIAFSCTIVVVSLSSLMIFPQVFLRSVGLGGITATLLAGVAALVLLPALLGVLGPRVDAFRIRRRSTAGSSRPAGRGRWHRAATRIMRRPAGYALVSCALLVALGLPFTGVRFGGVDHRVLPPETESRRTAEAIERGFPAAGTQPIQVIITGVPDRGVPEEHARAVSAVPGVTGVQITGVSGHTARLTVAYAADPLSARARSIVDGVRALPSPPGTEVLVGGAPAELADLLADLRDRLPWMALIIVVTTVVLLGWAFRSVLLPVKALAMNALSLGASFGALVWIFQDGHLSGVLSFTPTGTLNATMPILVLAIVFGLSMDYEVFLLSRIREDYDATGDTPGAIATGLQHTGGVITGAALLLIVVTAGFTLSGITIIKLIGVAVILAVAIDATVVRIVLVPATMRLLGDANWWAPRRPRRAVWQRPPSGGRSPVSASDGVRRG